MIQDPPTTSCSCPKLTVRLNTPDGVQIQDDLCPCKLKASLTGCGNESCFCPDPIGQLAIEMWSPHLRLTISGITCFSCVKSVKSALLADRAVNGLSVTLSGQAYLQLSSPVPTGSELDAKARELCSIVADAGFRAELIPLQGAKALSPLAMPCCGRCNATCGCLKVATRVSYTHRAASEDGLFDEHYPCKIARTG